MSRPALRAIAAGIVVAICLLAPASARAQEDATSAIWEVARQVLIDPTTYAPAVISYEAMHMDWKTSQVLFAHGWVEANPRLTISGRPFDVPVAYDVGERKIRGVAVSVLQSSALNNLAVGVGVRVITARYPSHRKLIRTLSWVERIGFASLVAYRNSADHIQQARTNRRLAREHGYVRP